MRVSGGEWPLSYRLLSPPTVSQLAVRRPPSPVPKRTAVKRSRFTNDGYRLLSR